MGSKFVFTVRKGGLTGKTFTYAGENTLIVGRGDDCSIVLPDATVSHHHCRIDIIPPLVLVRDLGTLNGTWLNGKLIGQRPEDLPAGQYLVSFILQAFPLNSGDRLGLGEDCELELQAKLSQYCDVCSGEMEDSGKADPEEPPICPSCRELRLAERGKAAAEADAKQEVERPVTRHNRCEVCGNFLAEDEVGLCATCQENPKRMLKFLLEQAGRGKRGLREIPGYRRIKLLGEGRWSRVWLVEEEASGRQMALKRILYWPETGEHIRMRFLREANVAAQLKHENVVRYHNLGQYEGTYFILMELCKGGNVTELLREFGGALNRDLATRIILRVLDGLDYAHKAPVLVTLDNGKTVTANGVVHRDVNPNNILLGSRNEALTVKVADFGLAKAFEAPGSGYCTPWWEVGGSPKFMPHQQYFRFKDATPEVDVWAAAATYYHMLTGSFAKPISDDEKHMVKFFLKERVPIRQRNPTIPEKLAEVIDYALLEDPIRVTSALELKRMILEAL